MSWNQICSNLGLKERYYWIARGGGDGDEICEDSRF